MLLRRRQRVYSVPLPLVLCAFLILVRGSDGNAVDYWASPGDPAVATNNDCGFISAVHGQPQVRRSFQSEDSAGQPLSVADRISSGDELIVPTGSRLEWTSGNNLVVVLGSGGRVKLGGIRSFIDPDGRQAARLDLSLLSGELRLQVRYNSERPESILALMSSGDVVVRRGDVYIFDASQWRCGVLAGTAMSRIRRGGMYGAPFAIPAGQYAGPGGQSEFLPDEQEGVRRRLPFTFELVKLARPPVPTLGFELEAP